VKSGIATPKRLIRDAHQVPSESKEVMTTTPRWSHVNIYTVFIVHAYHTSQYVVTRGDIFLGKWRSAFEGSSDGKRNVQSACALNT
jgi:hypothetical protein